MMMVKNNIKFNATYFILASLIFTLETLIALYVHDNFVRPYLGDVLVVILIYCFIKSFLDLKVLPTAVFVLTFAFTIEFLQYLNVVEKLGLENSKIARTVFGTSFSWVDIFTYIVGIGFVILAEYILQKEKLN